MEKQLTALIKEILFLQKNKLSLEVIFDLLENQTTNAGKLLLINCLREVVKENDNSLIVVHSASKEESANNSQTA